MERETCRGTEKEVRNGEKYVIDRFHRFLIVQRPVVILCFSSVYIEVLYTYYEWFLWNTSFPAFKSSRISVKLWQSALFVERMILWVGCVKARALLVFCLPCELENLPGFGAVKRDFRWLWRERAWILWCCDLSCNRETFTSGHVSFEKTGSSSFRFLASASWRLASAYIRGGEEVFVLNFPRLRRFSCNDLKCLSPFRKPCRSSAWNSEPPTRPASSPSGRPTWWWGKMAVSWHEVPCWKFLFWRPVTGNRKGACACASVVRIPCVQNAVMDL